MNNIFTHINPLIKIYLMIVIIMTLYIVIDVSISFSLIDTQINKNWEIIVFNCIKKIKTKNTGLFYEHLKPNTNFFERNLPRGIQRNVEKKLTILK